MASELRGVAAPGQALYAHIVNSSGRRWNGSSFETYASANYSTYTVTLTEQGSSGAYFGTFPSAIVASGTYEYLVYLRSGGSAAEGDAVAGTGEVAWSGTVSSDIIAGSMSGSDFLTYVKRIFKRTDKDTELYDAISDAIAELRRIYSFDEDEVETTTTAVISTLGQFQIALETNLGILIGDIVVVDGDDSQIVTKIAKQRFDVLYPNPTSTTATRDKPQHFCVFAGNIYFGPVPDSTAYTYRLNYSKGVSTITSSSSSVPFTKWYREPLRAGVLAKGFDGVGNDEQAMKYFQIWEFFKQQIMTREDQNQKGNGFIEYHGV